MLIKIAASTMIITQNTHITKTGAAYWIRLSSCTIAVRATYTAAAVVSRHISRMASLIVSGLNATNTAIAEIPDANRMAIAVLRDSLNNPFRHNSTTIKVRCTGRAVMFIHFGVLKR